MEETVRRAYAIATILTSAACLTVELDGRPCPCIEGYACRDDVCVPDRAVQDAGAPRDDGGADPADGGVTVDDAGAFDDAGAPAPECGDDDPCPSPDRCVAGACVPPSALCPAQFLLEDACDDGPPPVAELVAVCDDGATFPSELYFEAGTALGICLGPPASATIQEAGLTGTLAGEPDAQMFLELEGFAVVDVDIPAECTQGFDCQPSDGSGDCGPVDQDADACACTDVDLDLTRFEQLERYAPGTWGSGDGFWYSCATDGVFLLRRDDGQGLLGPILMFAPVLE